MLEAAKSKWADELYSVQSIFNSALVIINFNMHLLSACNAILQTHKTLLHVCMVVCVYSYLLIFIRVHYVFSLLLLVVCDQTEAQMSKDFEISKG